MGGLGVFLIVYGLYALVRPALPRLVDGRWALPFGFAAGCLGSAYNIVGVPVVVYGTTRGWNPQRFRGTLQAHFLVSGAFVVLGQGIGGLWTTQVFALYGLSLPAITVAVLLGTVLNKRIPAGMFDRYVYLAIVVFGVLLLQGW